MCRLCLCVQINFVLPKAKKNNKKNPVFREYLKNPNFNNYIFQVVVCKSTELWYYIVAKLLALLYKISKSEKVHCK